MKRLGKPVDRIIVSHGHPDHWAGLELLTARFPEAGVYSLSGVADFIRTAGEFMLGGLRRNFGDKIASRVTVPSRALAIGTQTFDGTRIEFKQRLLWRCKYYSTKTLSCRRSICDAQSREED